MVTCCWFCSTETRAQEYIAEKEERYARKLKFSEIINNMISDWQIKILTIVSFMNILNSLFQFRNELKMGK